MDLGIKDKLFIVTGATSGLGNGCARALLNDPDIILADEPTGNLDPATSEEIMNILFSISENSRTVIMATHNYNNIKKFPYRACPLEL